jgi:exodeoxyribonuclease V alpha subunit
MILECTITHIVFQDVGEVFANLETNMGKVSGNIAEGLTVGTQLTLNGSWTDGGAFGKSFKVYSQNGVIKIKEASEKTGELWLGWRLPNIGPERSKQLARAHGENLWQFMDSPEAATYLSSIRGLTPARVREILTVYKSLPHELRLAQFLGEPDPDRPGQGLRLQVFKLVIAHYHDARSLNEQIKDDLFELYEIPRVTFEALNKLAFGLGMEASDPRRVRGIGWFLMDEAANDGDTLMPWGDLHRGMKDHYVDLDLDTIKDLLRESSHLVVQDEGLQLTELATAEMKIAKRAQELLADEREQLELDLSVLSKDLDDSQRKAVVALANAPFAILTGGPGTGKTTVLKQLLALLKQTGGSNVRLASPTGKAAKRMTETTGIKATTIHKLLEWKPEGFKRDSRNPIAASVVIVDEASMIDTVIGAALFSAIGRGTRLILVGDYNQLPPVSTGQVFQDLIRSEVVPVARLTKTHRAANNPDAWVLDAAPIVLQGGTPSLKTQSDFSFVEAKSVNEIASAVVDVYRNAIAAGTDSQLQVLTPEKNNGAGTVLLNATIQQVLNPNWVKSQTLPSTAVLGKKKAIFVGDKVIYTKNDADLGLVNGSMGVVEEASSSRFESRALVRFPGETNPDLEVNDSELFTLKGEQIEPLMLAYAMTVHKAQGSEWKQIVVICEKSHRSMRRRLFYTAITRTSKNLVIIGDAAHVRYAVSNNPDENRITLLIEQLQRGQEE